MTELRRPQGTTLPPKLHLATAPIYSTNTNKRIGTKHLYSRIEIDRHVALCQANGWAPGLRWGPAKGERR